MTELMKRYEKEVGEKIPPIGLIESEYMKLKLENAQLRDQLRWRPVSEKPEKEQYFLANPTRASNKPRTFCFLGECSWESFVISRDIVEWIPIPPAPEGETT